jgi:KDO2-lipid IV(A) lauroyltransferase
VTPLVERVAGLLTGRVSDAAYAGGWALVRALPEGVAHALFRSGADLAWRRGGRGVDQLGRNLARVAPGQDLTRAALRSYARYWCEVFRLPVTPRERIVGGMATVGEHRLRESIAAGRGTVMALPHSGNWDHAGAWCGASGVPFTTVAERLRPESLYDRFVAFRESLGMEVLPLTGGPRPPYDVLVERLEAGGTLCLLADRDLSARGVDVEFFGATARMPAAGRVAGGLAPGGPAHGRRHDDAGDGRRLRERHRRAPRRLAHAPAPVARRPRCGRPSPRTARMTAPCLPSVGPR